MEQTGRRLTRCFLFGPQVYYLTYYTFVILVATIGEVASIETYVTKATAWLCQGAKVQRVGM